MRPKMMQPKIWSCAMLAYILAGFTPALAQAVTVQSGDEFGHGFMVRQGSTCYVLLPKHVAAGQRRVTVFSAAPVVHSGALVETPFWDGMDLAIGVVRGAIEKRCTIELSSLDISAQPESGARTQLLRLRQSGEPERVEMLVTDSQYLTLEADIADGKSELFKGTSGAFLFAENKPLGMVIEALSPTKGRFIRIEEIYQTWRGASAAVLASPLRMPTRRPRRLTTMRALHSASPARPFRRAPPISRRAIWAGRAVMSSS